MLLGIFKIISKIGDLKVYFQLGIFKIFLGKNMKIGRKVRLGEGFRLYFNSNNFTIKIGSYVTFRKSTSLILEGDSVVEIGDNVFFNNSCSISCLGRVIIGDNCMVGEGVKIYDHNHRYSREELLIREQGFDVGSVEIGRNVWIGSNVTILKNVIIGDNCVIGANCLIYKSIASDSVVFHKEDLIVKERLKE